MEHEDYGQSVDSSLAARMNEEKQFSVRYTNTLREVPSQYVATEINWTRNRWKRTAPQMRINQGAGEHVIHSMTQDSSCRRCACIMGFLISTADFRVCCPYEKSDRVDRDSLLEVFITRFA